MKKGLDEDQLSIKCDVLIHALDDVLHPPGLILVERGLLYALREAPKSFAELGDCLELDTEPLAKLIESLLNKGLIEAKMKSFLAFFQLTERGRHILSGGGSS
jgi:DNA-binding MarR family transcriptional regulator